MAQDGPERRVGGTAWLDLAVPVGALLYVALAFLPWASVSFDAMGRISASGYGLSPLVPAGAALLVVAGAWVLLPASVAVRDGVTRTAVPLGLAATAGLLTLVTWLRSSDYGFEVVPLLALLVTVAVAAAAASSLLRELRSPSGGPRPVPADPPPAGPARGGS